MNKSKDFKFFIKKAFISGMKKQNSYLLYEEDTIPNTEVPPTESEIKDSTKNFLSTVEQALKFKAKLPIGANIINSEKYIDGAVDKISQDLLNASVDAGSFSKSIQTNISKTVSNIEKEVRNVAAKEKQKQELQKQQEKQKETKETAKESYYRSDHFFLTERDDPISVGSIKGILKFTSQDKIAEVIKKMNREDFLKFIDGLQKTALDALAAGIENIDSSESEKEESESEENKEETGEEEKKGEEQEGNLKLSEL